MSSTARSKWAFSSTKDPFCRSSTVEHVALLLDFFLLRLPNTFGTSLWTHGILCLRDSRMWSLMTRDPTLTPRPPTKRTPTQSHNSLSICERYHHIIRQVFLKVEAQHPNLGPDLTLSISVHAVNTTVGPNGLVPTLLLLGTLPKLPIPSLSSVARTQK